MFQTKIYDICKIFRVLSFSRLCNFIACKFSFFLSNIFRIPIVWNQPWSATIEPASICQLKCPECLVGTNKIKRKNKFLADEVYDKILKQINKKTFWLNLYFQGEPLLDVDIFNKISKAHKLKFYTVISTNAQLINEDFATKICQSKLDKIIISLDGITDATYSNYRLGGDIQKVLNGISFIKKHRQKKSTPIIEVQMLVFSFNENQKKDLKKKALELGADKVVFKSPQFYNADNAIKNMSSEKSFQRYSKQKNDEFNLKTKKRKNCFRLWSTIVVTTDGDITSCCYDKMPTHIMGNVAENNIRDIWKGSKFQMFRKNFLKGAKPEICSNCK